MANSSSIKVQAEKHATQIFALAGRYLSKHSEDAIKELETLYDQTWEYYKMKCSAYDGVMAVHAHILALWNINEHFNLSLALAYSHLAEECYQKFLKSETISRMSAEEQQTFRMYLKNTWLICAYVDYCNDDFYGSQRWLQNIGYERTGVAVVALMASIIFRLTMDEGRENFLGPFHMFQTMDQMFTQPVLHQFEEDIIRTAYGFYELYYTHGVCDSAESVPYNPELAVRILTRAYSLFTDPQQKEWMQVNINDARKKC